MADDSNAITEALLPQGDSGVAARHRTADDHDSGSASTLRHAMHLPAGARRETNCRSATPTARARRGWTRAGLRRTLECRTLELCQSQVRNLGRSRVRGPSYQTGRRTTPHSSRSCGWPRPTLSPSSVTSRLAAATTASPAVESRPIRPVRAVPIPESIRITMATIAMGIESECDADQASVGMRQMAKAR